MVIRGVLFDKDGTLVDFFKMWVPAYREAATTVVERLGRPDLLNAILEAGGLDPTTDRVASGSVLASGTNRQVIETWRAAAEDWAPELDDRDLAIFHDHATRAPEPTADLDPLFVRLRSRGIALGVGTMDDTVAAEATLGAFAVRHLVDEVIGADLVQHPKPAADMIELFCERRALTPQEVVMVGDSPIDLQMGGAAGVGRTVGVLTGPSQAADLRPWADEIIPSIATLEAALRL